MGSARFDFPFHLGFRFPPKARLTALAIALCVAYVVGSFAFLSSFERTSAVSGEDRMPQFTLVSRADGMRFDPSSARIKDLTTFKLDDALVGDRAVTLVIARGPLVPDIPRGSAAPTPAIAGTFANQSVWSVETSRGSVVVRAGEPLDAVPGPTRGLYVAPEDFATLFPDAYGADFGLVARLPFAERERLRAEGFTLTDVPSIIPFFQTSAREIGIDLWFIATFGGALVALLTFEFLALDLRERRREIGIWRALGLSQRQTLAVLGIQVALMALVGFIVGTFLALATVGAATRAVGFSGGSVVPTTALLLLAMILGAALAGAAVPAWRASRRSVTWAMERGP